MSRDVREVLVEAAGASQGLPDVPTIARRGRVITWRRRGLRAAAVGVAIVAVVGVGQNFDLFLAEPLPTVEEPPAPDLPPLEGSYELNPGRYTATAFEDPFSVRISGNGWFPGIVSSTWVYLTHKGWHLHVQRWGSVIGSVKAPPHRQVPHEPVPGDLPAWFQGHPGLAVQHLQPVTVGGVDGARFDVVARVTAARKYPECEGRRCVLVANVEGHDEPVDIAVGERARFYILDMADGPVVIYWHAGAARFDAIQSRFDGTVDSIRFI